MNKEVTHQDTFKNGHPEEFLLYMETSRCTGCRSCELACSYHHAKVFNPNLSSIKIYRDSQDAHIEYSFLNTCDLCKTENIPACVAACSPLALRMMSEVL